MPTPPLPLATLAALADAPTLLPRVRMAIALVAREVYDEPQDTPGYPLRWNLAKTLLSPNDLQAKSIMVGLVVSVPVVTAAAAAGSTDPATMAATVTDDQLLTAVRDGWSAVAGVSPTTPAAPAEAAT